MWTPQTWGNFSVLRQSPESDSELEKGLKPCLKSKKEAGALLHQRPRGSRSGSYYFVYSLTYALDKLSSQVSQTT